ncbi:hypothetical protein GCM10017044_15970 [Kordiimonas sediminis]|uniref:Cell division and transport-associated protein TolA n=1 Tax=Kordiimonas sediminis TaxID=1735581 RepID=A0A919AS07_9PROT|nr:hypothetical protein [Kordiimonas sediminis]GHF22467.1 hypothetical protein GCM10017044_15970 [Kordiimonas sediminis]
MKVQKVGWILSVALHVGVVTVAMVGLPSFRKDRPAPPPPIAVDFVRIAEQTQIVAPEPEVETETVQEEVQPKYAREEYTAPAPAESVPLPTPKPEVKAPKPEPKPEPKPDPKVVERQRLVAAVTPQAKPKPPSRFQTKSIADLIDRSKKEETKPTPKTEAAKTPKAEPAKVDPFAGLRGRIATARLVDALSQKLARCWTFPSGAKGVAEMQVTVRIWLRPDGDLSRPPQFVKTGDMSDGFYRSFAESAQRAVQLCAPYTETIEYVKSGRNYIDFKFDGREFGGG